MGNDLFPAGIVRNYSYSSSETSSLFSVVDHSSVDAIIQKKNRRKGILKFIETMLTRQVDRPRDDASSSVDGTSEESHEQDDDEILEIFASDLSSGAIKEFGLALGVNKELQKLGKTLSTIKAVLPHAEELQIHNADVRAWLRRIKGATYEADNIVDDFVIEALRKKLVMRGGINKMVRSFVSSSNPVLFRFKMARRIKEIREVLDEISAEKSFHLETRGEEETFHNSRRGQTYSYVNEETVFGRAVEVFKIVDLLASFSEQELAVIPIIGMGGLGKTTVAQLVYNDDFVVTHFKQRIWVCVSEDFNVKKIIKAIIESATNEECPNMEMGELVSLFQEQLGTESFLLVLDDVWNEDVEKWNNLKEVLITGSHGSRLIVTSRSEKVSVIMGTVKSYQLNGLSDEDCWNLFKRRAFQMGEDQTDPEFLEIGRHIVRKCGGVPLAVETLGSIMRSKTQIQEWEDVKNNDFWSLPQREDYILPALRISYNNLPLYLRECFKYCSIFPKDHEYEKEMLIQLWIAHGFIRSSGGNRSLEDIGNEYIKELMAISFFQEPRIGYYRNLKSFKMHNLVHDLAQSVAGAEYFTVKKYTTQNITEGVQHLCFNEESSSFEGLDANVFRISPNIRTLVCAFEVTSPLDNIFSTLKYLRVLVFRGVHADLPNAIGKLNHLRFLQLSCDRIKTLPKSIINLQSLHTLKLWCRDLEELPADLGKMINLKHLYIERCLSLSCMPFGIDKLTSLQTLPAFIVSKKGTGCELNELNGMINLGGKLTIKNLEKVRNAKECSDANLKGKQNLEVLKLLWNQVDGDDINRKENAFDVLENLEPHPNLKSLKVKGYVGTRFPHWLMDVSLPNVVKVTLSQCRKCQQVPPLGQLPSLEFLELEDFDVLRFIEGKVASGEQDWFPSLRRLSIRRVPNLESWAVTEIEEHVLVSFPSLVELIIHECPKLKSMPLLPSVEVLDLRRCSGNLVHSLLQHVIPDKSLENSPSNTSLVSLRTLKIEDFDDLECFPEEGLLGLNALESLIIKSCPRLISLPEAELQDLASLQVLDIS